MTERRRELAGFHSVQRGVLSKRAELRGWRTFRLQMLQWRESLAEVPDFRPPTKEEPGRVANQSHISKII